MYNTTNNKTKLSCKCHFLPTFIFLYIALLKKSASSANQNSKKVKRNIHSFHS